MALIERASVAQRVLRHLGLPTDVPDPAVLTANLLPARRAVRLDAVAALRS